MSFLHPTLLLVAPLAALAAWVLLRRGALEADAGRFPRIHRLWADRRGLHALPGAVARRARGLLLAAAAALALLALARPQWGEVAEPRVTRSRDVMLALDLSRSMLAADVSPSRLARARLLVEALLDALRGERVGLTVFAGSAFVQSPLSADYEVLRDLLAGLDPSYLPQGGTDYAAMLRAAGDAFATAGDGDRYLVVLSDGEAHDDAWQALVPTLRERGIRVISLGVGTPDGAPVPDGRGGALRDASGAAVVSRLAPGTLQALAEQTGGTYRAAATWVDIADLVGATVARGRAAESVEQQHVRQQDRFQWLLAPALLLALLSLWIEFPVFPLAGAFSTRGRRSHRAPASVVATVLGGFFAWHASPCHALAAATDTPPPPQSVAAAHPPVDLAATVAALSARPHLAAADYARLATDTVGFAAQPQAPRGAARDGILDDALTAVARGERADAGAADWPALRAELERLRHVEDPPQQQSPRQDQAQQPEAQPQDGQGPQQSPPQKQQQGDAQAAQPQPADAPGQPGDGAPKENGPQQRAAQPQDQRGATPDGAPQEAAQDAAPQQARTGEGEQDAPDSDDRGDTPGEHPAPPAHEPMRLVGGGMPAGDAAAQNAADALQARARQVADADAPAVLFDRMNRAEGRPRAASGGRNW